MKAFVIKRLLLMIPLLVGITTITFSLTKALPGDPAYSIVGERSSPEIIEKIRKEIGADKGVVRQYAGYVNLLVQGELGRSYFSGRRVSDDIGVKLLNTMRLAPQVQATANPQGYVVHTVVSGDTFAFSFYQYDVPLEQIYALNNLNSESILSIGQQSSSSQLRAFPRRSPLPRRLPSRLRPLRKPRQSLRPMRQLRTLQRPWPSPPRCP